MSERPTPEQIAASHLSLHRRGNPSMSGPSKQDTERAETMLAHFRHAGYVIVHPDDVPSAADNWRHNHKGYTYGWNDCRRHIFGDDS